MPLASGTMLVYDTTQMKWVGLTPEGDGYILISDFGLPIGVKWKKVQQSFKIPTNTNYTRIRSSTYTTVATTIFDKEDHGKLLSMKFISYSSKDSYDIRLVDTTNQTVLEEMSLTNTFPEVHMIENINYVPTTDITLEVQARYTGSKSDIYVDEIMIIFDNVVD